MNIIVSLIVGAVVGWLASILIRTDSREGLIRNVTAGVAGAYLGGWLLSALQQSGSQGSFSFGLIVVSSLGAATLLLLVRRFMPL
jgi:uncharacterized membrane protein YeaQ/YmgE (transglycosylase-associated protein family)